MPTTSKAQTQAETAQLTQFLFAAAQIAEDFDNEDLGGDLEEDCQEIDADSDMIELVATNALAHVFAMSGDGSRGPYHRISRSKDFFTTCLSSPDQRFRHLFRSVAFLGDCRDAS